MLAGDVVVSAVYANVDYIGLADVWWADLVTGESGGHGIVSDADAFTLPEHPGTAPLRVDRDGLTLAIEDDDAGTHLRAQWAEPDGRAGRLDVTVALPPGHESLNVVIPWSDELFNYTSKHQARPATGTLVVGEREIAIEDGRLGRARRRARPLARADHMELGRGSGTRRRSRRGIADRRQVDRGYRLHRERHHRRRSVDEARRGTAMGVRLGRAAETVARRRSRRTTRHRAVAALRQVHEGRRRRDASSVRYVVGPRRQPTMASRSSSTTLSGFAEEARQDW